MVPIGVRYVKTGFSFVVRGHDILNDSLKKKKNYKRIERVKPISLNLNTTNQFADQIQHLVFETNRRNSDWQN